MNVRKIKTTEVVLLVRTFLELPPSAPVPLAVTCVVLYYSITLLRRFFFACGIFPFFEFIRINCPRTGIGLLYYGQNSFVYPGVFPAGARGEIASTASVL